MVHREKVNRHFKKLINTLLIAGALSFTYGCKDTYGYKDNSTYIDDRPRWINRIFPNSHPVFSPFFEKKNENDLDFVYLNEIYADVNGDKKNDTISYIIENNSNCDDNDGWIAYKHQHIYLKLAANSSSKEPKLIIDLGKEHFFANIEVSDFNKDGLSDIIFKFESRKDTSLVHYLGLKNDLFRYHHEETRTNLDYKDDSGYPMYTGNGYIY